MIKSLLRFRYTVALVALFFTTLSVHSQEIAIKNNILYDVTGSLNLAGELRCGDKSTLQLGVSYNPWTFSENKKIKHIYVQPEYRYWLDEAFIGHFVGVTGHYAQYNFCGTTPLTTIKDHRYQGNLMGLGVTYGYQWMLSAFWNIEANITLGYAHLDYDKYGPEKGAQKIKESNKNYFGPMQAGISIIYFIK